MFDQKRYRCILSQVLATTASNLHEITFGLNAALLAIIIAALSESRNELNKDEILSMTAQEASWFGSIPYLAYPVSSILSGFVADLLGRKRSLILMNVPYVIGWFLLYQSTEICQIFVGEVLILLAEGLGKIVMLTYISEVCEPSTRGVLFAFACNVISFGLAAAFILNTSIPWRQIALIGLVMSPISVIALVFIPESPQWLLSKNRTKEAEKSLKWLRRWVASEKVTQELTILQRQSDRSTSCASCIKGDVKCSHPPPTWTEQFSELKRKRTLKPLLILTLLILLNYLSGGFPMLPFSIQIFRAYESPMPADQAVTIRSFTNMLANVAYIFLIRFGKRRMYLLMGAGIVCSSFVISCYGFICLPSGYNSFDSPTFHLANPNLAYIPFVCLFLWDFFTSCGFIAISAILLSELFPFKSKAVASGIKTVLFLVIGFISTKSYYNLEQTLSLPGVSLMYCLITGAGLIVAFFILPETEGRSLEDIELHFADNSKKLTDRKIAKSTTITQRDGKV